MNIAVNGFGRIGRAFLRSVLLDSQAKKKINIVAINLGPCTTDNLDTLFGHDTIMGKWPGTVSLNDDMLIIDEQKIKVFTEPDATKLPWKALAIDWVVEASGHYTKRILAQKHINAGAQKVLITAPAEDEDITIVPGINHTAYNPTQHSIVSLGSCTTNCFAPVVKIIHETFGITSGLMTTTHAITNDQVVLDVFHKDPRRARAAANNIIPTKTGASKVITKLFPDLEGKLNAVAIRVPVPIVSLVDFTFIANKSITVQTINDAFKKAAETSLKDIVIYQTKPLVSSDFIGTSASCIFDSLLTQVVGNTGKIFAWYDNEFGYSCRLRDFLAWQEA